MIIKILNNNSSTPELCLLEFQGELVGELAGNELGEIVIKKNVAEMTIGSHFLEGKIQTLAKPFLVTEDANTSVKSLNIIGIAYKKILFGNRPRLL